ncbi:hypothetical protein [Sneathiella aquimaris]|uniref:hypothetical protein n=1 Tax=Sneathiella aquimaris TaxID=2599305 RepID=UPI00146B0D80|nr:hypothetical protein [Sneathiella aquimaris]
MTNSGFEYSIVKEAKCFFVKHYGVLTKEILINGNKAVADDCAYRGDLNRLIDVSGCSLELSSDDIRLLSSKKLTTQYSDLSFRGAYLVDTTLAHGLARMFNSRMPNGNSEYQIFDINLIKTPQVVLDWLSLSDIDVVPTFISLRKLGSS